MSAEAKAVAASVCDLGTQDLEDQFPGRWSPRRAIQDDLRVLASAVADATEAGGWWTPGSGALVDAGLVVGIDLHGWGHMERWIGSLAPAESGKVLRPSTFLHALPSTPAATLGLLFGLERYQATLDRGVLSGFGALAHGIDLLASGRLERVVVASLSAVEARVAGQLPELLGGEQEAYRLGVALCLERGEGVQCALERSGEPPLEATPSETLLGDVAAGYRVLAAPSLHALLRAGSGALKQTVAHRDPCFGAWGVARIDGEDVAWPATSKS